MVLPKLWGQIPTFGIYLQLMKRSTTYDHPANALSWDVELMQASVAAALVYLLLYYFLQIQV
jgi:hypothetical protein